MLQESTTAPAAAPTGGDAAAALSQMGVDHLITEMTTNPGQHVVQWVVTITLVLMSVMSIYWIVVNFLKNANLRRRGDNVTTTFWETANAQDAIRHMEDQPKSEPFSKIALDAAQAAAHHQRHEGSRLVESLNRSEFVDRALRQAVTRESMKLENGLTVLATVGSTAPFVGLLGTVWGIYGALIRLGAGGQASIDAVAGPVGEALIMTAVGLFVAIPAVLGYNFFVRLNRITNNKFDTFAHDLHDFFATGARVGEVPVKR
ncbi:MotA/TolQ/ExbB proton channel family protein [Luteimonas panaciterrae]|uniref:MotA/TolQ/ExbB proton channel family protein n=1 Tax=Luteimonas panaciterrae TaxID=363885 RepID=UPI001CF95280|nr:MotA/TolQ/ExbB proton channel family protein [Luteimonas panaciterrae]